MERAKKVIVVSSAPPAPQRKKPKANSLLEEQKKVLELTPDSFVVDNSYPRATSEASLRSVKTAAYQVNIGERRAWPNSTYYAVWRKSPDDDKSPDEPDVYQLLIGRRDHMKEEWAATVNRAGSRKRPSGDTTDAASSDPFEQPDVEDSADVA